MPEELQIDYKESTLYSTKGEFTFGFKNLPENAIAVCCYTKGSGKAPTSVKADELEETGFEGFPPGRSDLKFITILKTENGEKYGPECDLTIYYGKLPLVLKPTGNTLPNGNIIYTLECKDENLNLNNLGIKLDELIEWNYDFPQNMDNNKNEYDKRQVVFFNQEYGKEFYIFFENTEYSNVFGNTAAISR